MAKKCYEQGDLTDFILAICAIGNEEVNAQVRKEANQKKVILNVVDRLEFCDFALPAKIRRGDLLVTFQLMENHQHYLDICVVKWNENLTKRMQIG